MKKIPCTCNQHTDYKGCCDALYQALNDCKYGLKYRKDDRAYIWRSPFNTMGHCIDYCPWCGTKLPTYLGHVRADILRDEYGVTDECDKKQAKHIPAEFLTDEWWKKRGL